MPYFILVIGNNRYLSTVVDSTSLVVRQMYFILRVAVVILLSIASSFHACRSRAGRLRARR